MRAEEEVKKMCPGAYYDFDKSVICDHFREIISKRDVREPCAWADALRRIKAGGTK